MVEASDEPISQSVGPLALDDRARLFMLGVVNLLFVVLVWRSIGSISSALISMPKAEMQPMALADVGTFVVVELLVAALALVSSVWDWRNQVWGLLIWSAVYTVNRQNEGLVRSAQAHMSKELAPVGNRQVVLLRGLLVVMSGAIVCLLVRTGGVTTSPYTQYGFTIFLLAMLLTDIFVGRASLALLGLMSTGFVLAFRLTTRKFVVSYSALAWLTMLNFAIQLAAVAMASETFEPIGFSRRRREGGESDLSEGGVSSETTYGGSKAPEAVDGPPETAPS